MQMAADPNLILTLARDNKATELTALIQQGVPPNAANKVGMCSQVLHRRPTSN